MHEQEIHISTERYKWNDIDTKKKLGKIAKLFRENQMSW